MGEPRVVKIFVSPFACSECGAPMVAKIVEMNCKDCPVKEECTEIKEKWFFFCPLCGHEQVDFVIVNELGSFLLPMHGLN